MLCLHFQKLPAAAHDSVRLQIFGLSACHHRGLLFTNQYKTMKADWRISSNAFSSIQYSVFKIRTQNKMHHWTAKVRVDSELSMIVTDLRLMIVQRAHRVLLTYRLSRWNEKAMNSLDETAMISAFSLANKSVDWSLVFLEKAYNSTPNCTCYMCDTQTPFQESKVQDGRGHLSNVCRLYLGRWINMGKPYFQNMKRNLARAYLAFLSGIEFFEGFQFFNQCLVLILQNSCKDMCYCRQLQW